MHIPPCHMKVLLYSSSTTITDVRAVPARSALPSDRFIRETERRVENIVFTRVSFAISYTKLVFR